MKQLFSLMLSLSFLLLGSCTEYTPKPKGYFRIEPPQAQYQELPLDSLPYSFAVSQLVTIELPESGSQNWINLSYPSLNVTVYCSYLPITQTTLSIAENESRSLVARQIKEIKEVREQVFSNPDEQVYGTLFLLDGEVASPIQFMLTDSVSHFFRGAVYYNSIPNADSLAPVTDYLRKDIIELIQSFIWKR